MLLLKATILTRLANQAAFADANLNRKRPPNRRTNREPQRRSRMLLSQAIRIMQRLRKIGESEMTKLEAKLVQLRAQENGQEAADKNSVHSRAVASLETKLAQFESRIAQYNYAEALIRSTPIRMTPEKSIETLNAAKKILKSLTERYERNYEYRKLLTEVSYRLGQFYRSNDDSKNAELNFRNAIQNSSQLIQEAPRNRQIQYSDFVGMLYLTDLLLENEDYDRAVKTIKKSIRGIQNLPDSQQRMPEYFHLLLSGRYRALAVAYSEQGESKLAEQAIRDAEKIRTKLRLPANAQRRRQDAARQRTRRSSAAPD